LLIVPQWHGFTAYFHKNKKMEKPNETDSENEKRPLEEYLKSHEKENPEGLPMEENMQTEEPLDNEKNEENKPD